MFVRTYHKKTKEKTYTYHRILESYRNEDGKPAHRILGKLPQMSLLELENLKIAFRASRRGEKLTIAKPKEKAAELPPDDMATRTQVLASLRYLDVAVSLALWRQCGLHSLISDLLPTHGSDVPPGDVVAALVVQRCVAPGSKRYAKWWMPRTALPELLGIDPNKFNNTRIHRVLEALDKATPILMRRLARMQAESQGGFAALFLDVSDARFVGTGPEDAEKAKCKEGMYARKIGIVLLCADDGTPLRWAVVPGRRQDAQSMSSVFEDVQGLSWTKDTPIVCDRSMGKTKYVSFMASTGMQFLTAMTTPEFGTYAPNLPHQAFHNCDLGYSDDTCSDDIATIVSKALEVGFKQVSRTLLVLDQGIFEPDVDQSELALEGQSEVQDKTVIAMTNGRAVKRLLDAGRATNFRAAGTQIGLTKDKANHSYKLTKLNEDIQKEVLSGKAVGLSINDLKRVAALPQEQQRQEFDRFVREIAPQRQPQRTRKATPTNKNKSVSLPRVRVVVMLNPELMLQKRTTLRRRDKELKDFVKESNKALKKSNSRKTPERAIADVEAKLRACESRDLYTVTSCKEEKDNGNPGFQLVFKRKETVWIRRNRYAGITVLVSHPDTNKTADELAKLYREKNQVEQDFHIIKSFIKVRPVWHYTDPKVKAHVTICMLALFIERLMARRLRAAKNSTFPAAAFEEMSDCRLDRIALDNQQPFYQITSPDHQQLQLLRALNVEHLVDIREMADLIRAR